MFSEYKKPFLCFVFAHLLWRRVSLGQKSEALISLILPASIFLLKIWNNYLIFPYDCMYTRNIFLHTFFYLVEIVAAVKRTCFHSLSFLSSFMSLHFRNSHEFARPFLSPAPKKKETEKMQFPVSFFLFLLLPLSPGSCKLRIDVGPWRSQIFRTKIAE